MRTETTEPAVAPVAAVAVAPAEAAWTPPSWDEVVREHADRVYRLAYRLSGNQHDAEDLTQETFIRVFRSLASYKPGTFEGWLHRITTNLFLDMARRRSRLRMEGLPEDTDRLVGDDPSPEQVYSDTHLDPDLQAALDELPPESKGVIRWIELCVYSISRRLTSRSALPPLKKSTRGPSSGDLRYSASLAGSGRRTARVT